MSMSFDSIEGLEITEAMTNALAQDSISEPTPVQRASIAPILAGRHVVVESGTGTGKTLAYLLPILQRMKNDPDSGRTVVFAPTAELAMQTLRVAERYKDSSISTGNLVGSGSGYGTVTKSTRFIVGTPGRILEMYAKRKLKRVTTIVLDEPDPILANKDANFLREVLSRPDPKVQLIIAAATMGPNAEQLVRDFMGEDCVRAQGGDGPMQSLIQHYSVLVRREAPRDVILARFIEENKCKRVILFVNQDNVIRHLYRYLDEHRLRPVSLFSERNKEERRNAVAALVCSKARILITNDAAARGLDVPDVDWVLHYQLPHSAPAYVHRAGRTGRAGHTGRSVVFFTDDDRAMLRHFAKELGIEFTRIERDR